MRVLFLTHSYPRWPGDAAGSFLLRLASALAPCGVQVAIVAPAGPGLPLRETIGGIAVTRYRYAPATWERLAYTGTMVEEVRDTWSGRLALLGLLAAGTACALRLQREYDADLLHAHWWFPGGIMASAVSAVSSIPYMVTSHGSDVRLVTRIAAAQPFFRGVMRQAAAVTVVSRWLAQQVLHTDPRLAVRVEPMPVATELFAVHDDRPRTKRILFVGRLNEQKGLGRLFDAMAHMTETPTVDVVGDGPESAALRSHAAALGLADRVRWHGMRPQHELPDFYRRATLLAVPSSEEGLGLAAIEAQLCGTPVVAFDSGGIADTMNAGETGILVPARDTRRFAQALDSLVSSPDVARRMGAAGISWATERFAPEAVAARYAAIYRDALAT
ncbi:MAG: 2-deoxystreptamine glucosyltransferase [Gemmatimonadaceae bacterium]|nr:2-deoxystreptamine glucosyltransferase [Gemmatimonadaceae bacterium]